MKKADTGLNVFLMALSVLFFVVAQDYPYYFKGTPGPGVFPIWISVALFILCAVNILKIWLAGRKEEDKRFFKSKEARNRVGIFYLSLVVYVAAVSTIGIYLATFLYCIYIYHFFDKFSWKATLPTAVGICLFVYLVFFKLLKLRLPMGFWH